MAKVGNNGGSTFTTGLGGNSSVTPRGQTLTQADQGSSITSSRFTDGFESTPTPFTSSNYQKPTTVAYANYPVKDVIVDEPALDQPVLRDASERRFDHYQPGAENFTKHEKKAEYFEPRADQPAGKTQLKQVMRTLEENAPGIEPKHYRIHVAGEPVYARVAKHPSGKTANVALTDRHGKKLSTGVYGRNANGGFTKPTWRRSDS